MSSTYLTRIPTEMGQELGSVNLKQSFKNYFTILLKRVGNLVRFLKPSQEPSNCISCLLGLQTPNEAFFHCNPEYFCLGRQFGQINFGAFGVFSAKLSEPILVQRVHVFPSEHCFPVFSFIII